MRRIGLPALLIATLPGLAQAADRLTEPAIVAFVIAKNDALTRRDWDALRADYLPTAQIVGLYYDRGKTPHVHNGPAATDLAATAALMSKRAGFKSAVTLGRVFISPDGQRATATVAVFQGYDSAGAQIRRAFDETLILDLVAGQPKVAQEMGVERVPGP